MAHHSSGEALAATVGERDDVLDQTDGAPAIGEVRYQSQHARGREHAILIRDHDPRVSVVEQLFPQRRRLRGRQVRILRAQLSI